MTILNFPNIQLASDVGVVFVKVTVLTKQWAVDFISKICLKLLLLGDRSKSNFILNKISWHDIFILNYFYFKLN
jgi:hypothetical protein